MTSLRLCRALAIVSLVVAWSCSGPNEPEPVGPAAVISIGADTVLPGSVANLPVRLEYTNGGQQRIDSLNGFELRIAYDPRHLSFLGGIQSGPSISGWEYFTYRYGRGRGLEWGIVPNTIHVVSVREMDNGVQVDPPQLHPEGTLMTLEFLVTSDWEWVDSTIALIFRTEECGDNTLRSNYQHYYIAMDSFDGDVTALTDTLDCARRFSVEPLVGFRGGSVTIVPPVFGPLDTLNIFGP